VQWLWPHRIAAGKLTVFIGDPGAGKSTATIDIASRVTRGGAWPDGQCAPIGNVVLLTAEEGDDTALGDTVRPRIELHGGDSARIFALQAVREAGGKQRAFSLVTDLVHLETAIDRIGNAALIVIDPLSAYLGDKDSYKDSEIRTVLAPLAALAGCLRVAVIAIIHLTKDSQRKAIYRALGSVAFVAAARAVFAFGADKDDADRGVMACVKSNLGKKPPALAFRIDDRGLLTWEDGHLDVDADSLLSAGNAEDQDERKNADEFLLEVLSGGEVPQKEVLRAARENAIAERTLNRAKRRLMIESRHEGQPGKAGQWFWSLPKSATPPPKVAISEDVATFGQTEAVTPLASVTSPKMATPHNVATFDGSLREECEEFEL